MKTATPRPSSSPARPLRTSRRDQAGKVGKALLLWMLGVPGSIVFLYLIFGH